MPRDPIVLRHEVRTRRWRGSALRIVVLSDLHVISPWTPIRHIARVVDRANALSPDLILMPGDFLADHNLVGRRAEPDDIVAPLQELSAPLGVFATLGNHDWAECALARSTGNRRNSMREAFAGGTVRLLDNEAVELGGAWLAGVDSIRGEGRKSRPNPKHDLDAALSPVPEGADLILMAHEPDLWADAAPPAALTVSGHTHGGQIVLGNWRPLTPSRYGQRYAHGLHEEDGRNLVVSGGIGFTAIPVRIGVPPEITLIELSGT
ncbi:metallophosphoesterase [Rhodobacterales bacterium HKCCE3408]|nr:metallophosphoesterase [Rhodobacterales bacterium HKCCE3408]